MQNKKKVNQTTQKTPTTNKTMSKTPNKPRKRSTPDTQATFTKIMEPSSAKFKIRNILQAIIGATILAIPIGFTEETWRLGETLPTYNILLILALSVFFIFLFAYRNFSKNIPNFYWYDLFKRVVILYIISFAIVTLILVIIQRAPWSSDWLLAFNRTVIVAFPSSLSATIAGNLK